MSPRPAAPVVVVTASVPYSVGDEVFVQDELEAALSAGVELVIVPARRRQQQPNDAADRSGLSRTTVGQPLVSAAVLAGAAAMLGRHPIRCWRAAAPAIAASGSRRNLQANLGSLAKSLWLARLVKRAGAAHVHAYWLGHTATMAMVAAEITGVPWSATGFRWDIDAANALDRKLRRARFVRCADELGLRQLRERAERLDGACPIELVRTGVALPDRSLWASRPAQTTLLCCPAMFVEKKGHRVLIEAFTRLAGAHPDARLDLFGSGPLEPQIRAQVAQAGNAERVRFRGVVGLDELRTYLRTERPVCVLASFKTADGQEEGIPVTLVEALANGAPVVSTRSGSIATLVVDGCGFLVPPSDVDALAEQLLALPDMPEEVERRCANGYDRLRGEYDLAHTAARMVQLWDRADGAP